MNQKDVLKTKQSGQSRDISICFMSKIISLQIQHTCAEVFCSVETGCIVLVTTALNQLYFLFGFTLQYVSGSNHMSCIYFDHSFYALLIVNISIEILVWLKCLEKKTNQLNTSIILALKSRLPVPGNRFTQFCGLTKPTIIQSTYNVNHQDKVHMKSGKKLNITLLIGVMSLKLFKIHFLKFLYVPSFKNEDQDGCISFTWDNEQNTYKGSRVTSSVYVGRGECRGGQCHGPMKEKKTMKNI